MSHNMRARFFLPSWYVKPASRCCHSVLALTRRKDTADGPVNLTSHIRAGTNTLRFIQLRDTSGWVFVVHAGVPPNAEATPSIAVGDGAREWEAFVARASGRHGAIVATARAPMAMAIAPV